MQPLKPPASERIARRWTTIIERFQKETNDHHVSVLKNHAKPVGFWGKNLYIEPTLLQLEDTQGAKIGQAAKGHEARVHDLPRHDSWEWVGISP